MIFLNAGFHDYADDLMRVGLQCVFSGLYYVDFGRYCRKYFGV